MALKRPLKKPRLRTRSAAWTSQAPPNSRESRRTSTSSSAPASASTNLKKSLVSTCTRPRAGAATWDRSHDRPPGRVLRQLLMNARLKCENRPKPALRTHNSLSDGYNPVFNSLSVFVLPSAQDFYSSFTSPIHCNLQYRTAEMSRPAFIKSRGTKRSKALKRHFFSEFHLLGRLISSIPSLRFLGWMPQADRNKHKRREEHD